MIRSHGLTLIARAVTARDERAHDERSTDSGRDGMFVRELMNCLASGEHQQKQKRQTTHGDTAIAAFT